MHIQTVFAKFCKWACASILQIQWLTAVDMWIFFADIICAVRLLSRENLLAFCEAVQLLSPVGSYIKPTPGLTVGYGDEVIFADGTFLFMHASYVRIHIWLCMYIYIYIRTWTCVHICIYVYIYKYI